MQIFRTFLGYLGGMFVVSCSGAGVEPAEELQDLEEPIVYGADDRIEGFLGTTAERGLAKSVALLVGDAAVSQSGDPRLIVSLPVTQGSVTGLCADEVFQSEWSPKNPNVLTCTAFLIGTDLMATAGHCFHDALLNPNDSLSGAQSLCNQLSVVFDFIALDGIVDTTPPAAPAANVYHCRTVLEQKYDEDKGDYAVFRLDRAVTNRPPLAFRRSGKTPKNSKFMTLGHPSGIPLKISRNGTYYDAPLSLELPTFFGSDLDVNEGNSGGPVFNVATGLVEGLVHAGPGVAFPDYTVDNTIPLFPCLRARKCTGDHCSNGRRGSYSRTNRMAPFAPNLSPRTFRKESVIFSPTGVPIAGDFNGDHITDVFWYAAGTAVEELWWFQTHANFDKSANPPGVSGTYTGRGVGDFDGDGRDDILLTKSGNDFVLYGSAAGFTSVQYATSATTAPLVGDFDGDGNADVVLDSTIWWGTTRSTLGTSGHTSTIARPTATRFATGDFDGDGFADIFWANGTSGRLWFGSSLRGSFSTVNIPSIPAGVPLAGDYDGDGRTDLFFYVAGSGTDTVYWAKSTRGAFTADTVAGNNTGTYAGVTGDFDGDSASDIIWSGSTDLLWSGKSH